MMHASNDPIVDVIMETDEALLGRIARGEEDAFVAFVERHHARLER